MKDKIQKLIEMAEARKKDHSAFVRVFSASKERTKTQGCLAECTFFIEQLTLLLNEQPEAITEDAQFRKHDVRRIAASEQDQVIGDSGADSSETAAVRQNEQIRKTCATCKKVDLLPFEEPCLSCSLHNYNGWEAQVE